MKEESEKIVQANNEYKEVLNKMQQMFNLGLQAQNQNQVQKQSSSPYYLEKSSF